MSQWKKAHFIDKMKEVVSVWSNGALTLFCVSTAGMFLFFFSLSSDWNLFSFNFQCEKVSCVVSVYALPAWKILLSANKRLNSSSTETNRTYSRRTEFISAASSSLLFSSPPHFSDAVQPGCSTRKWSSENTSGFRTRYLTRPDSFSMPRAQLYTSVRFTEVRIKWSTDLNLMNFNRTWFDVAVEQPIGVDTPSSDNSTAHITPFTSQLLFPCTLLSCYSILNK